MSIQICVSKRAAMGTVRTMMIRRRKNLRKTSWKKKFSSFWLVKWQVVDLWHCLSLTWPTLQQLTTSCKRPTLSTSLKMLRPNRKSHGSINWIYWFWKIPRTQNSSWVRSRKSNAIRASSIIYKSSSSRRWSPTKLYKVGRARNSVKMSASKTAKKLSTKAANR